jgi:hypothetical protein
LPLALSFFAAASSAYAEPAIKAAENTPAAINALSFFWFIDYSSFGIFRGIPCF